jgi:hypothetical protein
VTPVKRKCPVWVRGIKRGCRNCPKCYARKRRELRKACLLEQACSVKTHFITVTFRPGMSRQYVIIQRWLKRVRKSVCSDFKYVCVSEPHKRKDRAGRDRIHYHLLIFDKIGVTSTAIRGKWRAGS